MANFFQNLLNPNKNPKKSFAFGSKPSPSPIQAPQYNAQNVPLMTPNAQSGATGTNQTKITPPSQNTGSKPLPPSGQNYMASVYGGNPSGSTTPKPGQQTPQTAPTPSSSPQNAYLKYLTGMFDENNVTNARKAQEDSAKRLADIQSKQEQTSLNARREYEKLLDTPGMLKAGAEQAAQVAGRRSDSHLADLAIQESAAARSAQVAQSTYDQYINAGKSVYEAEQAAAEAKQKQDNWEQEHTLNKYKAYNTGTGTGGGSSSGQLSALAQAVQNGTIPLSGLTKTQAGQVAAELASAGIQSSSQQGIKYNIELVNSLLNNPNLGRISGAQGLGGLLPIPGSPAQLIKNQYNQLKSILSLDNREKLKGSGAISDFEFRVLSDAATALGRNLSDAQFKAELQKVKDVFEGKYRTTQVGSGNQTPTNDDELLAKYGL